MPSKKKSAKADRAKKEELSEVSTTPSRSMPVQSKPQRQTMGAGMILILIYFGLAIVSYFSGFFNPAQAIGPIILTGISAFILNLIYFMIVLFIFVGILKRASWARKLTLIWIVFVLLLGAYNIISYFANPDAFASVYEQNLPEGIDSAQIKSIVALSILVAGTVSLIINILIFVYIYRRKAFFYR